MEEEYQYEDLETENGKFMLKLAYEWIEKRSDRDPNDVDIIEIYKDNGQVFIEANCFQKGKWYIVTFRVTEEWLVQRRREEKLKEIGI
jgi:hypothetical protein